MKNDEAPAVEITDEEGTMLVRLAREAIEKHLNEKRTIKTPAGLDEKFYRKMGVFVTLNTHNHLGVGGELRGCIGQPLPERPLLEALIDSAISSAVHDPRFEKVKPKELDNLVVEISVLPADYGEKPERVLQPHPHRRGWADHSLELRSWAAPTSGCS